MKDYIEIPFKIKIHYRYITWLDNRVSASRVVDYILKFPVKSGLEIDNENKFFISDYEEFKLVLEKEFFIPINTDIRHDGICSLSINNEFTIFNISEMSVDFDDSEYICWSRLYKINKIMENIK